MHHTLNEHTCSFPKDLNKKWKNLRQTKYAFNLNMNFLNILYLNQPSQNTTLQQKNLKHSFSKSKSNNRNSESSFLRLNCVHEIKQPSSRQRNKTRTSEYEDSFYLESRRQFVYLVNDLQEW